MAALGQEIHVEYKPMGVVAVIAPWNYPFNLAVVPAISALAAGNSVILKPSEVTPLVGLLVEELFRQAAFPPGVIQVLHGGGEVGQALIQAGPDKIFFTGSAATGREIMAAAAEQLIPVQLELGGKDAMVVLADAPLERSVNGAVWGGFTNSGQVCMAVERVYVEASIYSEFLDRLLVRIDTLGQGSGRDEGTGVYDRSPAAGSDRGSPAGCGGPGSQNHPWGAAIGCCRFYAGSSYCGSECGSLHEVNAGGNFWTDNSGHGVQG